jgi:small GTP-binding protein
MADEYQRYKAKVCLLGDPMVGKTSLIRKFVLDQFSDEYLSTLGAKVTKREMNLNIGGIQHNMSLMIWDIVGQADKFKDSLSDFKSFRPPSRFYSNTNGVLIVCDLTRRETFDRIKFWYDNIRTEMGYNIPTVLLGNKFDLKNDVKITYDEIMKVNRDFGFPFFYTSAKTGENVEMAFIKLSELLIDEFMKKPV